MNGPIMDILTAQILTVNWNIINCSTDGANIDSLHKISEKIFEILKI